MLGLTQSALSRSYTTSAVGRGVYGCLRNFSECSARGLAHLSPCGRPSRRSRRKLRNGSPSPGPWMGTRQLPHQPPLGQPRQLALSAISSRKRTAQNPQLPHQPPEWQPLQLAQLETLVKEIPGLRVRKARGGCPVRLPQGHKCVLGLRRGDSGWERVG